VYPLAIKNLGNIMNFNFALILTLLVFITGLISLVDICWFAKQRTKKNIDKRPFLIEQARSFFPVFLAVLIIRSFIIQFYHVPSGSLEPTILPGDYVAVNQFAYGLRLPVINTKIIPINNPKIGDIALFNSPAEKGLILIKRVVGVPGDHIQYKNKVLYINGKEATQTFISNAEDIEPINNIPVKKIQEDLNGVKHDIYINPVSTDPIDNADFDVTVPAGSYFMMGDNRDMSADSRYFGMVSDKYIIGKGFLVVLSWNSEKNNFRFDRFGTVI
jgi:signal peptidase I